MLGVGICQRMSEGGPEMNLFKPTHIRQVEISRSKLKSESL